WQVHVAMGTVLDIRDLPRDRVVRLLQPFLAAFEVGKFGITDSGRLVFRKLDHVPFALSRAKPACNPFEEENGAYLDHREPEREQYFGQALCGRQSQRPQAEPE